MDVMRVKMYLQVNGLKNLVNLDILYVEPSYLVQIDIVIIDCYACNACYPVTQDFWR